jgi:hypothetical protein
VVARRGAPFYLKSAVLFRAESVHNLTLVAHGAKFRMWKDDYFHPPYCTPPCVHDEFRMTLSFYTSSSITILGLTVYGSGGDGIFMTDCHDVRIDGVLSQYNARQGISIISSHSVRITNSSFVDTNGTAPQSGVWLQGAYEGIELSGVECSRNQGGGLQIESMVNGSSVSMSFEDITMYNNSQFAIMLEGETTTPGAITFERLSVDGCTGELYAPPASLLPIPAPGSRPLRP